MNRFSARRGTLLATTSRAGKEQNRGAKRQAQQTRRLRLESLEDRRLLSVSAGAGPTVLPPDSAAVDPGALFAGAMPPNYIPPARTNFVATPVGDRSSGPNAPAYLTSSMTPSQIRKAYGIDSIVLGSIVGDGAGQTIAIVDAYKNSSIVADLAAFNTRFGLPAPPSFTVLNQNGGTDLSGVAEDANWAIEIALDVEWAHAIAPAANIVLFEANDNGMGLYTAVNTARNYPSVSVISLSWGSDEFLGETFLDNQYFKTPPGHSGVTFVAATGDWGSPGIYPAYSPNVVAVGGTLLDIANSSGTYNTETGWSGSGGGTSVYESRPSYQNSVQSTSFRQIPDVAFNGGPESAVLVVSGGVWWNVYGTSFSAPAWGGIFAIVNQLRVSQGMSVLNSSSNQTQAHSLLYALQAFDFHDILTGSNGGFSCGPGYDQVTGRGTPVANVLTISLVLGDDTTAPVVSGVPNDGAGADVDYQTATTALSANWAGVFFESQSGISAFEWAIGTTPGATNVLAFTSVGTAGSATKSGLALTSGTTYYVTARATNGAGLQSTATSDGVTIDTTLPAIAAVPNDGLAADVDYQTSTTTISANWAAVFSDAQSGISGYEWAIGTTVGGTTIQAYTAVGTATSATTSALALIAGTKYYVTIRATNGAGLQRTAGTDGVTIVGNTRTWNGASGIDGNWTTAANWLYGIVPVAGDTLVFAGAAQTSTNNDFPAGTVFDSIVFANGGFTLSGNGITLSPSAGVAVDNVAGQNGIDLAIAAASSGKTVVESGSLQLGPNAQSVVLSGGGADIRGGSLVFDYTGVFSPATTIQGLLAWSYDNGTWDRGQFLSSTASSTGLTLGWRDDGASQVMVKATYAGDFNLDGTVDQLDLNLWMANAGRSSGATFPVGDANYDGVINLLDLDLWKATYGQALPVVPVAGIPPAASASARPNEKAPAIPSKPASTAAPAPVFFFAVRSGVSAANSLANAALPARSLRAAHDAVFGQLAKGPGALLDGPFANASFSPRCA